MLHFVQHDMGFHGCTLLNIVILTAGKNLNESAMDIR